MIKVQWMNVLGQPTLKAFSIKCSDLKMKTSQQNFPRNARASGLKGKYSVPENELLLPDSIKLMGKNFIQMNLMPAEGEVEHLSGS